ncbi:putative Adenine/guanine permease AZG1, partial [Cocos nucifera]
LNSAVAKSWFGKRLKLIKWGSTFTMELHAGTIIFLAMILVVNASILIDSSATCSIFNCDNPSPTCKFPSIDVGYVTYLEGIHRDLIVATATSSIISSIIMGVLANLLLALTPEWEEQPNRKV